MAWEIPNEDQYWENVRESLENPRRPLPGDWDYEPEYEKAYLFLDEELDEIEEKHGYPIEELTEGDLLDIVYEFLKIDAEDARWDPKSMCIEYRYQIA